VKLQLRHRFNVQSVFAFRDSVTAVITPTQHVS